MAFWFIDGVRTSLTPGTRASCSASCGRVKIPRSMRRFCAATTIAAEFGMKAKVTSSTCGRPACQ